MKAPTEAELHRVAGECLFTRVRMLDRVVTRIFESELRPLGLRVTQMMLLIPLMHLRESTATDLGRLLHLDKSTLSRNLTRVIDNGWILEREGDGDGRVRQLRLSASGRRMVKEALPAWQRAQKRTREALGGKAIEAVYQAADGLLKF